MGKYAELIRRSAKSVDYWTQVAIRSFVSELTERMVARDMNKAALAAKIGASPAYVSKVMRGDANFTLETMTKLAMAVGGKVQARIVDGDSRIHFASVPVVSTWQVYASSARRAIKSATNMVGAGTGVTAANDWHYTSVQQRLDTIETEEVRAA